MVPLDHPIGSPVGLSAGTIELLLADAADVAHVTRSRADPIGDPTVIGPVEAEVLGDLWAIETIDHIPSMGRLQQLVVVDIGAVHSQCPRPAVLLDK